MLHFGIYAPVQKLLLLSLLFFCALKSFGQVTKTEDFNIVLPEYKVQSQYSFLEILDSRKDTASYGIVQKGAFNKKALVQPKIPISTQLISIFENLKANPDTAPKDTLVLQLDDIKFAEKTEMTKETGFFFLRAKAYAKKNGSYFEVSETDLAETVNAMDVTQKNYRNASRIINEFLSRAMSSAAGKETTLSYEQVKNRDEIEKQALPLYANEKLTDGIYRNFTSFKNQLPDITDFKVNRSQIGKLKGVEILDDKNKYKELPKKDVYAFVENGVGYISTEYGYYMLTKKETDYYYTGRIRVAADTGTVIAATVMFGIIGGAIASNNTDVYEIMIDPVNGATVLKTKIKN